MSSIGRIAILATLVLGMTAVVPFGGADAQGRLDDRTIEALRAALDDERHAQAVYGAVIDKFGEVRPFVNIIRAEQRHEQMVLDLFARYDVAVPENRWSREQVEVPATVEEACRTGIAAEKANVAMYDGLLTFVKEADIRAVFSRLREVSQQNHLRAFERCASGLGGGRGGRGPGGGQGPRY
jgi:hypothetical protein